MDAVAVPVGLLAVSLLSCVDLYRVERKGKRIRLSSDDDGQQEDGEQEGGPQEDDNEEAIYDSPDNDEDDDEQAILQRRAQSKQELLARAHPEGRGEGIPVDIEKWWMRIRIRKAALIITLVLVDIAACVELGWDAATGAKASAGIVEDSLMLAFWTLLVTLAVLSFPKKNLVRHWRYTVYLTLLTSIASISIWARLLVPSSTLSHPVESGIHTLSASADKGKVSFALSVIAATLSFVAFMITGTMPRAPPYHFHSPYTYTVRSDLNEKHTANVSQNIEASVLSMLLFSWVSPVIKSGHSKDQMGLDDLPHLSSSFRTITLFRKFRAAVDRSVEKHQAKLRSTSAMYEEPPRDGLGYAPKWSNRLLWRLVVVNKTPFILNCLLAFVTAGLYYLPAFFLQKVVKFLEVGSRTGEQSTAMGFAYCFGLLLALVLDTIITGQLWFLSNVSLATAIRVELNAIIFCKTLKRKDVTGSQGHDADSSDDEDEAPKPVPKKGVDKTKKGSDAAKAAQDVAKTAPLKGRANAQPKPSEQPSKEGDEDEQTGSKSDNDSFSSKSQVLNLFSVDADRVADSASWSFSLIDAPVELIIGTFFLYQLIGWAGIAGVGVTVLFLPINHITSKAFARVQDNLMSARDRRVSLMNEVLTSIRYIKFMAYEKPFEERILRAREEELKQQRYIYLLEVAFNFIWGSSPVACVVVSFYVYTKIMGRDLTPSIAFTSLAVFHELEYAINVLPDTFISALQCFVSLRRLEKYLNTPDVENVGTDAELVSLETEVDHSNAIRSVAFVNATVTWPSGDVDDHDDESGMPSPMSGFRTPGGRTPGRKFMLPDLQVEFPVGELTLVCGPLGSGKTLLLLALLGEADLLSGQIVCPRSPVNTLTITSDMHTIPEKDWVLPVCAYVPQSSWLLNASIQDNILFGLPLDYTRLTAVLEACSLLSDLEILEDGIHTEIGEKGVNLSGGQKARISLARAVYSRASYLFLDDVLSAVDAHTSAHIYDKCLRGPLLSGRTVILVSHHVQLCAPGASLVLHLDNGMAAFIGSASEYMESTYYANEQAMDEPDEKPDTPAAKLNNKNLSHLMHNANGASSSTTSLSDFDTSGSSEDEEPAKPAAPPRKLIEDEARATGKVSPQVWLYWLKANGGAFFWVIFAAIFIGTKGTEVLETYWLRLWSNSYDTEHGGKDAESRSLNYYLTLYAIITFAVIIVDTLQWLILYIGGLRASRHMYKIILRATLRAPLRFFDTMALGRLLNRFGKDFEQIDAQLPDHWGKSVMYVLGVLTTLATIASVSPVFIVAFAVLCVAYSHYATLYMKTAREMRRLDSVTKSPVFSLYGEAISGVAVIRAFGAPARFLMTQIHRVDKNLAFFFYLWSANRWISVRFSLLSALLVGLTAVILLAVAQNINASIAGFALTFALNITSDMLYLVRRFTALELAMVGVERIKEYTEIQQEPPEIVEPRPPAGWPYRGEVVVDNLCMRYAPELPRVLHGVSFKIEPGQKVGIVGSTGSGKSTMALSFFRFMEADEGSITIDGLDIAKIGLSDLRSRLTIIPQDPTILSGTLRSTLDPLDEFQDYEIFDALKRARLLPTDPAAVNEGEEVNYNPFNNLETEVTEQGGNFSSGEKQLICLARALLAAHPLILMDEATSSVDYETDALITTTIAQEFKNSSLLVIAHRLRTVIGFDKILVLHEGKVAEFDSPATLIADQASRFHGLCKATGRREFKILTRLAKRDYPAGAVLKRRKTKRSASGRQDSK